MPTSARNNIPCRVTEVVNGPVNAEVHMAMANGRTLTAIITNTSAQALQLEPGKSVTALVKASSPILMVGEDAPRTSARNCLNGTVTAIKEGVVSTEVTLDIDGASIVVVVTKESATALGLAPARQPVRSSRRVT